jgi:two-component system sensor histidine kinase/response regulator
VPHILVVDDVPDIVAVMRSALEAEEGYRVTTVTRTDDALAVLGRDPPDMVLLDVMMPGTPAFEVARLAARGHVPVLFMTGAPESQLALSAVAAPYIVKPFRLQALLARTRAVLADREWTLQRLRVSLDDMLMRREALASAVETARQTIAEIEAERAIRALASSQKE